MGPGIPIGLHITSVGLLRSLLPELSTTRGLGLFHSSFELLEFVHVVSHIEAHVDEHLLHLDRVVRIALVLGRNLS